MNVSRWSVWLANLDPVVGSEQGRTRPIIVVSVSSLNNILPTGMFVATSVAIGVVAFLPGRPRYHFVPVIVGLAGACFLFYGSMLLIFEARLALSTIHAEMDFIWRQTTRVAPAEVVEHHKPHFVHFRSRK